MHKHSFHKPYSCGKLQWQHGFLRIFSQKSFFSGLVYEATEYK